MTIWIIAGVAFISGLVAPILLKPTLRHFNLVDIPNHRSSHTIVTLRGGGLAVLFAILTSSISAAVIIPNPPPMNVFILGIAAMAMLGFMEDIRGIPVKVRLVIQGAISFAIAAALLSTLSQNLLWAVPISIFGVIYVNTANFMDGVNGISALHGITIGGMAVAVGATQHIPAMMIVGVIVMGSFGGFLPWNFPKAQLFLGDVGSYILGAVAFVIGIWTWGETTSLFLSVAPMAIYLSDVFATLAIRASRGRNLFDAHREHIYQQIQLATHSHAVAAITPLVGTVLVCLVATAVYVNILPTVIGYVLAILIVGIYLSGGIITRWSQRTRDRIEAL